jgi:protein-L-isoaspartate(D-aspartate) O-methyltransferase
VDNAAVIEGVLAEGAAKHGPYDVIVVEGAVEQVPAPILTQLKDGGRIGCIFMEGALGVARIGYKIDGEVTWRFAFNASAPVLPGFQAHKGFVL